MIERMDILKSIVLKTCHFNSRIAAKMIKKSITELRDLQHLSIIDVRCIDLNLIIETITESIKTNNMLRHLDLSGNK